MKLTMEDILLMNALEKVSGVSPKDCIAGESMVSFLVKEGDMGKAIGKAAGNIKALEGKIKKRVEIVAYRENPEDLVALALEVKVASSNKKNGRLFLSMDGTEKRKALSNISRLKRVREFVKRNYGLDLIIA